MSLWSCPDHGMCGPGACCNRANRVEVSARTADIKHVPAPEHTELPEGDQAVSALLKREKKRGHHANCPKFDYEEGPRLTGREKCSCGHDKMLAELESLASRRRSGVRTLVLAAPVKLALREVLNWHHLTGIECDHDAKTDVATCGCATWRSEPEASISAAVNRWVDHVIACVEITLARGDDTARSGVRAESTPTCSAPMRIHNHTVPGGWLEGVCGEPLPCAIHGNKKPTEVAWTEQMR